MKLKKLLALALAGVLMLALLTGCSGDGNGEDRLVAVGVADRSGSTIKVCRPGLTPSCVSASAIRPSRAGNTAW